MSSFERPARVSSWTRWNQDAAHRGEEGRGGARGDVVGGGAGASASAMASASSRRSCRVRRQAERVGLSWTIRERPGPAKPMTGSWAATPASKARRSAQRADSPAVRARTGLGQARDERVLMVEGLSSLRGK